MRRVKRGEAEQTIVDLTDNRKLIVMVSTSKARQIIYNPNNGTYNPDFSKEPMVLTPELYITGSSTNVIATAETVKWYVRPNTLGQRIPIVNNDTYSIGNDFKLTISKNIMKDMLTMEFILEVIYKETDSDFRTTIPHHMELINISMGENGNDGIDGINGLDGETGLQGPKGLDSYTHLAYANDEIGTQDFSLSDSNRSYIGMYVDNTKADSDNPSDYKWTKVEGMPGDKGIQGPKGANGETPWFHIAYATNDTGTEGFSVSDSIGKTYIGQYTDYIENDSTKPSDYAWTKIKGEQGESGPRGLQGLQGPQGNQGVQGPKGLDSYTHIAYATNETGTSGFSTSDPVDKLYIGMYVDNTKADSDNPSDYKWTKARGDDGTDGADGIPGKPGADGRTPYFHTAYANSEDGVTGFSTTISKDKLYLGHYTNYDKDDPNDPSLYTWTLIKGEDGKDGVAGKNGVGVSNTDITYAKSTNGTTAPSTGYTTTVPTLTKGNYLWTKTVWTYTDKTTETGYSVSYIAKDGNDGSNGVAGKDGVGIKTTTITYAKSTNGTTAPSTGYTPTIPVVANGQYLWTKTVWTYTDKTTETGYSVAKMGNDGKDGVAGKDGVGIKTTTITYAQSASGTVKPATGYTPSVPPLTKGNYLWTKTVWTYTDNTNETGYSVSYIAKDGNDGSNGIAGKDGVGIKKTTITYAKSTSGTVKPTSGYTETIPKVDSGQYLWTKTTWTYTDNTTEDGYSVAKMGETGSVGPRGLQGLQGPQGNQGVKGPKGLDSFTHIAYSTSPTGATGFSTKDSTNKTYIGMYVDNTKADSDKPKDYEWTLIKGEKGADGSQGIPGKAGANGKTPYFHVAYLDTTNTMLTDPYFKNGTNGLSTYNNANDGSFTMTREANVASTTQPRGNNRIKFVHTKAGGSPDRGGFVNIFTGIPSHTYYIEFDAYIPVGASLNHASNYLGAGGGMYWVTSNEGTGSFQTYAYIIKYGTGSVSSAGHISIAYPNPTFTWWVGYYQRSDITNKFSITSNTNSNYIGQYTDYTKSDSTNPTDYRWSQIREEEPATLAIITPDGTTVRDTTSSLKLESKLFVGGKDTTADSYKWYYPKGSTTTTHSTGKNTSVSATLIKNSLPIFLEATYKGTTYTSSVTINDISDVYTSIILGVATFKNGKGSNTYTVKLYRNGEEIDPGGSIYSYEWEKLNSRGVKDTKFTKKGKTITINASEIDNTNLFNCYIYTK